MKTRFRVKRADREWIAEQLEKGNLFIQNIIGDYAPCGAYRNKGTSYDAMTLRAIEREIEYGTIYFELVNR